MSALTKALYGELLSTGLRARLYEFDQVLAGNGCPFRLTPERYAEARMAIAKLYSLVKTPELEISPQQAAGDRAHADEAFQCFLRRAETKRKRPRKGPGESADA